METDNKKPPPNLFQPDFSPQENQFIGEMAYRTEVVAYYSDRAIAFIKGLRIEELLYLTAWILANAKIASPYSPIVFAETYQAFSQYLPEAIKEAAPQFAGKDVNFVFPKATWAGPEPPVREFFQPTTKDTKVN